MQYIKVNLTITYLKGSELINDEPLCTEYLLNIKSSYKKDENYFISKMLESIEKLKKDDEISIQYMNFTHSKIKICR